MNTLSDIYKIPKHTYLTQQQAIWWVCFLLRSGDTYQAEIQAKLKQYPKLKLSTCVLNKALNFMVEKNLVINYQQPIQGRGKARKMYQINAYSCAIVNDFANLWRVSHG